MALRFAPIVRVSTEKQKKKGESLRTQETQIRQYIAMLEKAIPGGACIPEYCWQYKGQEHATPNQERVLLDRLLKDSSKDIFDVVICCHESLGFREDCCIPRCAPDELYL